MNTDILHLTSSRLHYEPIGSMYLVDVFQHFTPEVARYTFPQPTGNMHDTRAFIDRAAAQMREGTDWQVVVLQRDTHEFVGCAGLHHLDTPYPEPGLWLRESMWGQGYGTEIVQTLIRFANTHVQYEYLHYPVCEDNIGSRKIAEKCGGILQPGVREVQNMSGTTLREVVYHIPTC